MPRIFLLAGLLVTGLMPTLFVSGASAALLDIVVVGTWEAANNPIVNPFGLAAGDNFVMKATYDDATFFNGQDGVTASIDPAVNPGTSFEVIIPHPGPAPSPLQFDHNDHTDIGFAPTAQIEFDGPDAGTPGNFRNFEIHVDFIYIGDNMDLDLLKGDIQEETNLINVSEGGNLIAIGGGSNHLAVVTPVTADAGGPYVFNRFSLTLALNGTSGGGAGFPQVFDWTGPGGALANSPGANITFGLAESGLANTIDTSSIDLIVTEDDLIALDLAEFASASDQASVSYLNFVPLVQEAAGTSEVDGSITFSADVVDPDLNANALVAGFENVDLDFLFDSSVFLSDEGNLDVATLLGIFGSPGTYEVIARATDLAGTTGTKAFNIDVSAPLVPSLSPLGIAMLLSVLGFSGLRMTGLAHRQRRRG